MAKKVDLKAVKAAKQKKIAIGGAVLFVGVLAFSVPHTLKMLHPSQPKPKAAHSLSPHATPTATAPVAIPLPGVPVANSSTGAAVLTAELAPAAREGQLSVLSASFKSKDPFRQLINADATASTSSDTTAKPAKPAKPVPTLKVVPSTPPAATSSVIPGAAPAVQTPFLSAVISVNGVREGVDVKVDFPAASPVFHLVKVTKTTVKISVAGGALANGKQTLTLRRGKPLTLVNTADGTRYRLLLVSTSRAAAVSPAQDTSTSPTQTTPTPTPTTTTQTTTTPALGG